MRYYFLGALITPLNTENKPPLSSREFKELLECTFSHADLIQMQHLLRYFDLENLQLYWSSLPLTEYGNWSLERIEQLQIEDSLEPWLADLIQDQLQNAKRPNQHEAMFAQFFAYELQQRSASARVLTRFWQSQWLIAFVRAKKQDRVDALMQEPGYEHPVIASLFAAVQAGGFASEISRLQNIVDDSAMSVQELALRALQWQLQFLEEEAHEAMFTLDCILTYLLEVILIEQWQTRRPSSLVSDMDIELSQAVKNLISQNR